MQNVYMTPLNYTNFSGVKKSAKLHFHVTPREFADWMVDNRRTADQMMEDFNSMQDTMENDPDGEATQDQKMTMLRLVRVLAEISYGKPSDDGEVFDKSELAEFIYSAKYDGFRMFLFENPKEMETFINTLLNSEVIAEFGNRVAAGAASAQPDEQQNKGKNLSRQEVLELMRAQGITPASE